MQNYICTGERIDLTAPGGGLVAGQPYVLGTKVVVLVAGGVAGELVSAATEGVFEIAKAVGVITIGQKLYWDDSAKVITTVVTGNTLIGYAFKASLSGDATGFVTLVDNPGSLSATVIAALGTTANMTAAVVAPCTITGASCGGGATPADSDVITAIDAATAKVKAILDIKADNVDLETLRTEAEARLDAIETKVDAIIAALKVAGLMANA